VADKADCPPCSEDIGVTQSKNGTVDEVSEEIELISRKQGEDLANIWAEDPQKLDIPDTLLNSQHITSVVKATGLISPYFTGGDRYARLKKASYEGRIGDSAYKFEDENCPKLCFDRKKDDYLLVPKNSIIFVECDLDFRLPDFIALRFNLQIQHVHRGLLLGTGPLIDPGFWGKLCIPLHNLTDEDYKIPKDVGLIWIEFTKTTLPVDKKDPARPPHESANKKNRGKWDIVEFLDKAANQYYHYKVPIRSSLPKMFEDANAKVEKSAKDADAAAKSAEGLRTLNTIALVAASVALVSLVLAGLAYMTNLSGRNEDIAVRLRSDTEETRQVLRDHVIDVDRYEGQPIEARTAIPSLRRRGEAQQREIVELKQQIADLRKNMVLLQQATVALATQDASAKASGKD